MTARHAIKERPLPANGKITMGRFVLLLFAHIAIVTPAAAQDDVAASYPDRPVRFIVTTPAGGAGRPGRIRAAAARSGPAAA